MKSSKVAFLGMFTAFAMILSYIESQIPVFVAIPGIKLGLPNIAIIVILYKMGWKEAATVSLIRVILSSILFGTGMTLLYSLVGGALSLTAMILLKNIKSITSVTVSVIGGICHNIGQISVAIFLTNTDELIFYLPFLLISGTIAGVVIGLISGQTVNKMKKFQF